jgi:hypothetical protein
MVTGQWGKDPEERLHTLLARRQGFSGYENLKLLLEDKQQVLVIRGGTEVAWKGKSRLGMHRCQQKNQWS